MPSQDPLTTIFAEQVKSGMKLDLENDAYADPKGDNNEITEYAEHLKDKIKSVYNKP